VIFVPSEERVRDWPEERLDVLKKFLFIPLFEKIFWVCRPVEEST
jgi:hypothetical protein